MNHLMLIKSGINVLPLALQLKRNPHLWNQNTSRTAGGESPHCEVDDIWVRYCADPFKGHEQHSSVWYPSYKKLPQVRDLVFPVMAGLCGEQLGGVLITRVPPGGSVFPHVDKGWHAEYYSKFALQIESHPQQSFCYSDGEFISSPGDLYWFNNQATHWVKNNSPVERITMIICVKTDSAKP